MPVDDLQPGLLSHPIRRFVFAMALAATCAWPALGSEPTQPNVIVILADDMGLDSVSAMNHKMGMVTPAIDQLAAQGMSFTDAHSTSAVCSPTRYSVLTGRYNWRSRLKRGIVGQWERPLIEPGRLTLAEMFRQRGYNTACIGKWHLGWNWPKQGGGVTQKLGEIDFSAPVKGGPCDFGFDSYFGDDVPNWPPYVWRQDDRLLGQITTKMKAGAMVGVSAGPAVENWDFHAVLDVYTRRWSQFIRQQAKEDGPFFLYASMPSPHTPIAPHESFQGKSNVSPYADFLVQTDFAVGEIMRALRESGQADNTLVIFTCDNGTSPKADFPGLDRSGIHLNVNWRGWKADAYEGGHRVPFIARWPGKIKPGTRSDQTITLADIMATCADVLEHSLPADAGEDSVSLLPTLTGKTTGEPLHEMVVHHSVSGHFAVRRGKWKLLFCQGSGGWSPPREAVAAKQKLPAVQLYDLSMDPQETTNLQSQYPDIVHQMTNDLRRLIEHGRSNPGPKQLNHGGQIWWPGLPWPKPKALQPKPAKMRLLKVTRIWDRAPHNAFTDLTRFNDRWFCVFREGRSHVSPDGALRVIASDDGEQWESVALIESPTSDLRDAKITKTPDGRLMLSGAEAINQPKTHRHQSLCWFSDDGRQWSKPVDIGVPDNWLWRVTWHRGKAYGFGYGCRSDNRGIRLFQSDDGKTFETLIPKSDVKGTYPNETSLVFRPDGLAICLLRQDGDPNSGFLGTAEPPYKSWTWKSLGTRIGGPHLIQLPDGRLIAAVRLYDGQVRTSLCWLDRENATLKEALKLPSSGDTSYAGLVWHDDRLWVSYYSAHESGETKAKTSIYLAKVAIE